MEAWFEVKKNKAWFSFQSVDVRCYFTLRVLVQRKLLTKGYVSLVIHVVHYYLI